VTVPLAADARVLASLFRGMTPRGSHAERLERFYAPQADRYDSFRERLLHGRAELVARLPVPRGARIVELGAGTGRNADYFGARLGRAETIELVDLCPALLALARARHAGRRNVRVIEADAITYRPDRPADCVYLSYALTMIPDWRAALANAIAMLKPGGVLGAVDFYVSPVRHARLERTFWRRWFGHDGVRLSSEHLPALRRALQPVECLERRARVPYLPGLAAPYYLFVGHKRR
jgi:S-adenosylmethionine-diacylgycerolhomoserine-N-methlytransferase